MPIRESYLSIANAIAADIAAGRLRPGERLPPQRDFACRREIAVSTASRVYAELVKRGLVSGEVGRGTYVRAAPGPLSRALAEPASAPIDLEMNFPVLPDQDSELTSSLRELMRSGLPDKALRPIGAAGTQAAREAAAARGNDCSERCGNALSSVAGKHKLFWGGRPCTLRQIRGRDASVRRCSDAGRLSQCGIERRRSFQPGQTFCNQRRLIGKHRVIELEVDPDTAWLAWRRHAAPGIARDEGAPADFADDKPAAQ